MNNISIILKSIMKNDSLTQVKLSEKTKIPLPTLKKYLQGAFNPTEENLRKLENTFEIFIEELLMFELTDLDTLDSAYQHYVNDLKQFSLFGANLYGAIDDPDYQNKLENTIHLIVSMKVDSEERTRKEEMKAQIENEKYKRESEIKKDFFSRDATAHPNDNEIQDGILFLKNLSSFNNFSIEFEESESKAHITINRINYNMNFIVKYKNIPKIVLSLRNNIMESLDTYLYLTDSLSGVAEKVIMPLVEKEEEEN